MNLISITNQHRTLQSNNSYFMSNEFQDEHGLASTPFLGGVCHLSFDFGFVFEYVLFATSFIHSHYEIQINVLISSSNYFYLLKIILSIIFLQKFISIISHRQSPSLNFLNSKITQCSNTENAPPYQLCSFTSVI